MCSVTRLDDCDDALPQRPGRCLGADTRCRLICRLLLRHGTKGLIHHSDHGSQYLSIRYTERLAAAGIEASAGSVGDSYDNALAETIIGLYKTGSDPKAGAMEDH